MARYCLKLLRGLLVLSIAQILLAEEGENSGTLLSKTRIDYMRSFLKLERSYQGPAPFSLTYRHPGHSEGNLAFSCYLGDPRAFACLAALNDLFVEFKDGKLGSYRGRATFFIVNPLLLSEKVEATPTIQNENLLRTRLLKKELKEVDAYLEIFAFIGKSPSYYEFSFDDATYEWARYLNFSDRLVQPLAQLMGQNEDEMTLMAVTQMARMPALKLGVAQLDSSPEANLKAYEIIKKEVALAMQLRSRGLVREVAGLAALNEGREPLRHFYNTLYVEPFDVPELNLAEGLENFQALKKDEVVGQRGNMEIRILREGFLFDPQYPGREEDSNRARWPLPPYAFRVLQRTSLEELRSH